MGVKFRRLLFFSTNSILTSLCYCGSNSNFDTTYERNSECSEFSVFSHDPPQSGSYSHVRGLLATFTFNFLTTRRKLFQLWARSCVAISVERQCVSCTENESLIHFGIDCGIAIKHPVELNQASINSLHSL